MHLTTAHFSFVLLTPCFSGTVDGAEATVSELRMPPIRGHIRGWHREAFGNDAASRVWGSTGAGGGGSRVALRVVTGIPPSSQAARVLPHHPGAQGGRPALPVDARARLELQRLPACTDADWREAQASTRLWLVAGTLGYRSTRAAGSVWPDGPDAPPTIEKLAEDLAPILRRPLGPWGAAVAGHSAHHSWDVLRTTASDTCSGPAHLFGSPKPRKPSPVRFKVVSLNSGLCLLVLGPSQNALNHAEKALKSKPNPARWMALGPWQPLPTSSSPSPP